ncbi:type II toxin-antitoxin system RelE/ParE family toxin [Patescibacteria group bacterium]|nr:type II toxin-antitoxin system RelE/ParE family toxin [Patescibacteria group bacterium]
MPYQLRYSEHSVRNLQCLEMRIADRIMGKLNFFAKEANPLRFAKKLTGFAFGAYRFRVGNYRVIFDLDKEGNIDILYILMIKHRKDVYE